MHPMPHDEKKPRKSPANRSEGLAAGALKAAKSATLFPTEHRGHKGRKTNASGSYRAPQNGKDTEVMMLSINDQLTKSLLLKEAARTVHARENGQTFEMTLRQALIQAQFKSALAGSAYAQKHLAERLERCEREEALEVKRLVEIYQFYQEDWRGRINEAQKNGGPIPTPLPHPDDIVFEPGKRPLIIGPATEQEAAAVDQTCRLRDLLIMQDVLDERMMPPVSREDLSGGRGSAFLLALALNNTLPKRLRINRTDIVLAQMQYEGTTKRQLLKDVYRGWRALGHPVKRGFVFPPIGAVKDKLEIFFQLFSVFKAGHLDLDALARGDIDTALGH